jgi:monofunctional biosynthetic peptidoglycan transglycosylase
VILRLLTRGALVAGAAVAGDVTLRSFRGTARRSDLAAGGIAGAMIASAIPVLLLRRWEPPTSAMMIARRRREPGVAITYVWVSGESIAPEMQLAAIAAEDAYFRHHAGFDWESLRAAYEHNRSNELKRGGSTITQQLAKNLFLWRGRAWARKLLEAWFALLIEALWPKRRILEVYLNVAQFGPDVFGAESAAQRYLGKPARELTLEDAALLAAALPDPESFNIGAPSHLLRIRQSLVVNAIARLGDDYLESL